MRGMGFGATSRCSMEKIESVIQRCRKRIDVSLPPNIDDVLRLIQEIESMLQKAPTKVTGD